MWLAVMRSFRGGGLVGAIGRIESWVMESGCCDFCSYSSMGILLMSRWLMMGLTTHVVTVVTECLREVPFSGMNSSPKIL